MRLVLGALLCILGIVGFTPVSRGAHMSRQATVVLMVDDSGSMETSDPGDLRCTALRMFIALLDDGDRAGVVRFSTGSAALTEGIVALGTHRDGLLDAAQFCPAEGYTDIKAAFVEAGGMLSRGTLSADEPVSLILLTDGKPEIEKPYPDYEQEVLEIA
jgi:Mg-chelatase subunit ChlD